MRRIYVLTAIVLTGITLLGFFLYKHHVFAQMSGSHPSLMASCSYPKFSKSVKGIDTIIVTTDGDWAPIREVSEKHWSDRDAFVLKEVKEAFAEQDWMNIYPRFSENNGKGYPDKLDDSKAIWLVFGIASRTESIYFKDFKAAALSLHLFQMEPYQEITITDVPTVYPFIISDDTSQNRDKVRDGIKYLMGRFPELFAAYNGKPHEQYPCNDLLGGPK
jgi:hypothetical protein